MQTVIKNCNNIAEGKYYNENHRLSEEIQPRMGLFVRADLRWMTIFRLLNISLYPICFGLSLSQ